MKTRLSAVDRMNAEIQAACGPRKRPTASQKAASAERNRRAQAGNDSAFLAALRARIGGRHFIPFD